MSRAAGFVNVKRTLSLTIGREPAVSGVSPKFCRVRGSGRDAARARCPPRPNDSSFYNLEFLSERPNYRRREGLLLLHRGRGLSRNLIILQSVSLSRSWSVRSTVSSPRALVRLSSPLLFFSSAFPPLARSTKRSFNHANRAPPPSRSRDLVSRSLATLRDPLAQHR